MESSFIGALLSQPHLPLPLFCFEEATVEAVAEKVCACLNEGGGWIVVGASDKGVVGVDLPDYDKAIQNEIVSFVSPLPLVYVQGEECDGKRVVLVTIPKGSLMPYTYRGRYYVLTGTEAVAPSQDRLSQILRESAASSAMWERIGNLYADEDDLDLDLMQRVYDKGVKSGRLSRSEKGLRQLLSDLQLLKASEITNGVVALFAIDTKRLLPQCRLRIQLMLGGKTDSRYDDVFFIEGNVFEVQRAAIDYFKERLPRVAYFSKDRTGRYGNFEYPVEVLDEAISNALIHRDYSDIGDEVTVFVYPDKVEISNSGLLPDKLIKGKSTVLPHGSVLRNPLMAEVFYVAGQMEKTGRGLLLISSMMKDAGRKSPEWTSANGRTVLTLYSKEEHLVMNDRIREFAAKLKKGQMFSKADYSVAFDDKLSKGTIQNDLLLMTKLGLAKKVGGGPSTKYIRE